MNAVATSALSAGQYDSVEDRDNHINIIHMVQLAGTSHEVCMVHNWRVDPLISFIVDHTNYTLNSHPAVLQIQFKHFSFLTVQLLT